VRVLVACERVDAEGGTESYLRTLLPALVARGHDVRIVAREVAAPAAYGAAADAIEWSDEHDPPSAAAAARVASIATAFAPDVAAVHNVLDAAVLTALALHAPRVVYHVHDHRPFCPNGDRLYPQGGGICAAPMGAATCGWHALLNGCAYGPRRRTLGLIRLREGVARTVAMADATVTLSRYVADLAQRNGVPAERTRVVAPPLPLEAFVAKPAARPARAGVLFAGRIVPSKGGRSLIRALARVPARLRPVLRIAGEGPDLPAVLAAAGRHGVPVETLGRLDTAGLRAAYDGASLVAVPSLWGEPFGLVGIEALARGRPVVAYDTGAISEWMAPGGGRLVARGDEAAFATAVEALLEPDAWAEASALAFAASRAYAPAQHVERIEAIYAGSAGR
jgi:glycosyltransferase involved in cell wall biosynthesis